VPVALLTRPAQREEMAIVVYRPRPEAGKKTSTKQRFAFNRSDVTVILMIVYFALPGSPRWHLRRGRPQVAVDIVNRIIADAATACHH
jgi:hypothetical protein